MSTPPAAPESDLTDPYYQLSDSYRDQLDKRTSTLSDEELERVRDLFAHHNLANVPYRYWSLAAIVRAVVKREQKRRQERQSNLAALTGEPE